MSAAPATSLLLDMDGVKIDPAWALRIPAHLALRRHVLPFASLDGAVYVACLKPDDAQALQAVERFVNLPVHPEAAEPDSLRRALARVYGDNDAAARSAPLRTRGTELRAITGEPEGDFAVTLCEELLHAAVVRQASDMHLDPGRDGVQVRFRVDGVLETYRQLPANLHAGLISRLKVLSSMDIAEKRAPQDGGFVHRVAATGQSIDIRSATLPTRYGERMTIRLLALQTADLTLERLGMGDNDLLRIEQCLGQPHGLLLLTGPTGSGKTTTLYAAIRRLLQRGNVNIITIEDPIEYDIPGIAQVEVDTNDKVSFAKALRSVLRHDPDIIMIGEIRDRETADVAIKAALTGHLVLSTLHTNSAISAVTRLADMGLERYLVAATLRLAVAQRLVRKLCQHCRVPHSLSAVEAAALQRPSWVGETVYAPGGCKYCANRGYVGRLGLFELFPLDALLARSIAQGAEETALRELAQQRKLPALADDAAEKLLSGQTAFSEVLGAVSLW